MTVTYAEKLSRMPGYQAGVPTGQAPEAIAAGTIAQLASNESARPPHPKVVEAIARAAGSMNRYPDPDATLLRRRLADRYDTQPGNIAVGNGSCDLLLAAASALCEPGDEILYAWPSFSMYPYLPALTGAREIRVPLGEGDVLDLEAMAAEVTAATQLLIVCNPNNPTATHHPVAEIAAFLETVPSRVTVILDEAYIEFQTNDHPDASLDLLKDFPNLVVLRTYSKCYGLAGLRVGYAIGLLRLPRRGRRGAPAVQRQRARPGGGGGGDPAPGRRAGCGSRRRWRSGSAYRRGCARWASGCRSRRRTSPGSTSATMTKRRSSAASRRPTSRCAPARRSATRATSGSATGRPTRTSGFSSAIAKLLG